jgi:hypothetical protein
MNPGVAYGREQETPEAKARWFQSLSLEDRMELLCAFTDLVLAANPWLAERRHAEPTWGRVQVLSRS